MQIVVAWRRNKWVVERNAVEIGTYAYRPHAMDRARGLAAEAHSQGIECYLLIREPDGRWTERRPRNRGGGAEA
jgi:hypothetical protein